MLAGTHTDAGRALALALDTTPPTVPQNVTATDLSDGRTTSSVLSEAQLDSVAAQIYRSDGKYNLLPDVPPDLELSLQVRELRPGILQEITASVKHPPGEKPVTITTYHSNRLLEIGTRPQAAGLEGTRPLTFPAELGPSLGVYQVVTIPATDLPGGFGGRWQLQATPPNGLATERRTMSVSVFRGTPFGPGPQGTAATRPKLVAGTLLSSVTTTDLVVESLTPKAAPDVYTLYFYNEGATAIQTFLAEITCICPG
jgi:hypothetical protein